MSAHERLAYRRLFKNHGGHIGYWEGWVEGNGTVVLQYAKRLDGKATRREYQAEPKNVGRSNETTALEQAQIELDSRANKQLDKGYTVTAQEAEIPSTNALGLTKPMLAKPLDQVKPDSIDWADAFAQPKLDGHRALWKNGMLYSRQGKPIDMPHIVQAIHDAGLAHLHLDGELYCHDLSLQEISRLVKKQRPESVQIHYHLYDTVADDRWQARIHRLMAAPYWPSSLVLVPHQRVATFAELAAQHEENLAHGYEGTMLRHGTVGYQDGKRSSHLLKMKNFQDDEFRIVGVERGTPYIKGEATFEVPVWVLESHHGDTFTATAQGNMHEKHRLWMDRFQHVGRMLTVKFHYLSSDGIPQLPVALRFREDL